MKSLSYLCLFLFLFTSCAKEEKLLETISENRIKSIHGETRTEDRTRLWTETFAYNKQEQLIRVVDGNRSDVFKFEYDAFGNLIKRLTSFSGSFEARKIDSLVYDDLNQMIAWYSAKLEEEQVVSWRKNYDYKYDVLGKLIERRRYNESFDEETIRHYSWEDGNIIHTADIVNGVLGYEYFFEYDNKANYKKGSPHYILDPLHASINNLTKTSARMNSSTYVIDFSCGPCKRKYLYNLKGLPKKINIQKERVLTIEYL